MPYNFFNFRLRHVSLASIPELRNALAFTQQGILFQPYIAYNILKNKGVIEEPKDANYDYIPALVLLTTTNSWVEEPGTLGIAKPRTDNPERPLAATAAVFYEALITEGLTRTLIHEIGHTLGLRHPHDDFSESTGNHIGLFFMTYFTETVMSYSNSWSGALQKDILFEGVYPMRTFWSIYDLDAIDRAVISLMLEDYEANYGEIIQTLRSNGLASDDIPEVKDALRLARELAKNAVEQFKQHNYFDRLSFKGLGAQFESALDNAYAASRITGDIKNIYLPAIIEENTRLRGRLENLRTQLEILSNEVQQTRQLLEESRAALEEQKRQLDSIKSENDRLAALVTESENRASMVGKLREDVAGLENTLRETSSKIENSLKELVSIRFQTAVLTAALIIALAVVAGLFFLKRMRAGGRRPLPPPPPPPPTAFSKQQT
jgi:hypothetical protein